VKATREQMIQTIVKPNKTITLVAYLQARRTAPPSFP
jgi:hypothetical protein